MALTNSQPARAFGFWRRWWGRIHLVVGVILALYILLVINLIIFRHPMRVDVTAERQHTLSAETRKRLQEVNEEILVVFPTFIQRENPTHLAHGRALLRARYLLNEYMAAQPLIRLVGEVDVFSDDERWVSLRDEYKLSASQINRFVFMAGDGNTYRQTVTPQDLAVFGQVRDQLSDVPEIKEFRAEKAFTDVIMRLMYRERQPVYFTLDHGEMPLEPRSGQRMGLISLTRELETSGYEVKPLFLSRVNDVPSDARIVFIVQPTQPFTQRDLEKMEKYLKGGGRLLVAMGPQRTGLEVLLQRWGVTVEDGTVVERRFADQAERFRSSVQQSDDPIVYHFNAAHAATSAFSEAARFELILSAPRPLQPGGMSQGLEGVSIIDLVSNPEEGLNYYHRKTRSQTGLPRPADFSVGVAVEQIRPDRPPPDFQVLDSRMIVLSSGSLMSTDRLLRFSHRDFILNCVAWLAGKEEKTAVGAERWVERRMKMSDSIQVYLFWVPVIVFPGLCMAMGLFVHFVRRK